MANIISSIEASGQNWRILRASRLARGKRSGRSVRCLNRWISGHQPVRQRRAAPDTPGAGPESTIAKPPGFIVIEHGATVTVGNVAKPCEDPDQAHVVRM